VASELVGVNVNYAVPMSKRDVSIVFFFQAEDGIRDFHVTGVQTCALPIFGKHARPQQTAVAQPEPIRDRGGHLADRVLQRDDLRSEERRVGKECRIGWAGNQRKTKAYDWRRSVGRSVGLLRKCWTMYVDRA